jgi:hypothetical protein
MVPFYLDPERYAVKFTSETKHKPLTRADSAVFAPVVPYTYEDMRGVKWNVIRTSDGWRAGPAVNAYGLKAGSFAIDSFGPEGTADAAGSMVRGIEEHADSFTRGAAKESGWSWLLVIGGLYLLSRKGR